jgi:ABC-type multidrug transport system ATPase subunit
MTFIKEQTQCNCGATACPPGVLCLKDTLPELCPKGYYCPDYAGDKYECPSGSFCVKGASSPVKCTAGAICPAGSDRQYEFLPFFFVWIGLALGIFATWWLRNFLYGRDSPATASLYDSQRKVGVEMEALGASADASEGKVMLSSSAQKITIAFKDLGLTIQPQGKLGGLLCCCKPPAEERLKPISGKLRAGQITGIMGPSGSGKTTFMNVLCGKLPKTRGQILVNGAEAEVTEFRELVGFVPQNDRETLDESLTVLEALSFSANLNLLQIKPASERQTKVAEVMRILGLTGKRHSVLSTLSGGQLKRVNIGVELVTEPSALFLDEPTTGLDATTAQEIMSKLRKLAVKYSMVMCTVLHQPRPSIVAMLNQIILLTKGGNCVWVGSVDGAVAHFEKQG